MTEPIWIDKEALLVLHEKSLEIYGGSGGIRDEGLLDSALFRARNIYAYYPDCSIADLAAAYGFGLIKNHAFIDGNKRSGFSAIGLFLVINGYRLVISQADATLTMLDVAAGDLTEVELASWIAENMVLISP